MWILPRLLAADDAHPQHYSPTSMRSHEHEAATGRDPARPLLTARALLLLQLLARGYTSQQLAALLETPPSWWTGSSTGPRTPWEPRIGPRPSPSQ